MFLTISKGHLPITSLWPSDTLWWHRSGTTLSLLTYWGRVTHICLSKLTIIGSDNGLLPGRRQAIIWIDSGILLIRTLGTNFSEILSEIHTFSLKKMHLNMSSGKKRPFCLGLNMLMACWLMTPCHYLNQSWRFINCVLWHSPDNDLTLGANELYQWQVFQDYISKLIPHIPWTNEFNIRFIFVIRHIDYISNVHGIRGIQHIFLSYKH